MTATEMLKTFPIRYMEEVFNQRRFEVLGELFAATILGRIRQNSLPFLAALPDWHGTVDDIMVDGDKVINRWSGHGTNTASLMGMPATGKAVTLTGITIFRISDNKIVEEWTEANQLGMMQQLGVIPGAR